jgi:hypothetical protein
MAPQALLKTRKNSAEPAPLVLEFNDEEIMSIELYKDDDYSVNYYAGLKDGSEIDAHKYTVRKGHSSFKCEMARHIELDIGLTHIDNVPLAPICYSNVFAQLERFYWQQQQVRPKK